MESFGSYIITAFALVFVIEGLIYALFTDAVRNMMAMAVKLPKETLRNFGFAMASIGILLVWLAGKF